MQVEQTHNFTAFKDGPLKWPNSAACFSDGRIAVADGGNNRVCVFSSDGEALWEYGEQGFAPHNLREPIYVGVSPDQYLFVSDWHNHRVLVFTPDLEFSHTLFHMGPIHKARTLRQFLFLPELFLKHLLTSGVGAAYYFSYEKMGGRTSKKADYSLSMFFKGLGYYLCHPGEMLNIFMHRELSVRKVNGILIRGRQMIITQKANRCVSVYDIEGEGYKSLKLNRHIETYPGGKRFGRLCNPALDEDGRLYVCDQNHWCIGVLNPDYSFNENITFEEEEGVPMGPFSCAIIDNTHIAVARSFGIEINSLSDNKTVWQINDLGETHGIAWDPERRFLYYVDRSNSAVTQFTVPELT